MHTLDAHFYFSAINSTNEIVSHRIEKFLNRHAETIEQFDDGFIRARWIFPDASCICKNQTGHYYCDDTIR